ncbi:MAG: endonuclease III [Muribaculaceae bacterium]|nr:endonuclease III [Muribaculaceae bacterium]
MTRKERFKFLVDWFSQTMPVAETELHYENTFQLLVAVILSAQCTDKRVNIITPPLFRAFPTPQAMAAATQDEIFEYIKSCSYPNNKARNLLGAARTLVEKFGGEVPGDMDSLLSIPGVGRKTANVLLAVAFDQAAMAVDTHVFRVSERIGLTTGSKNPLQTEKVLVANLDDDIIPLAHHWLILHGRYVCKARRPDCLNCGLTPVCRYYQQHTDKSNAEK